MLPEYRIIFYNDCQLQCASIVKKNWKRKSFDLYADMNTTSKRRWPQKLCDDFSFYFFCRLRLIFNPFEKKDLMLKRSCLKQRRRYSVYYVSNVIQLFKRFFVKIYYRTLERYSYGFCFSVFINSVLGMKTLNVQTHYNNIICPSCWSVRSCLYKVTTYKVVSMYY